MEETVFSIELKYHFDEFQYQIIKIIDGDGNILPINRVEYFTVSKYDTIEDVLNWSEFENFLVEECGVKNFSTVEFTEVEYEDDDSDIFNVFFKKEVGSPQEEILADTLSLNT